ncbi:Hypothetical protein POVR2_LOCUS375 [uncultured virus]|nr:Hypothetical protein POVR2_LOCUS375 [uncultured virus]
MSEHAIEFDEERHKYSIDGVEMKCSVTELIHHFFPAFDSESAAKLTLAGRKREQYRSILQDVDPTSQEARDLVKAEWKRGCDEAAVAGTGMHKSIEEYYDTGKKPDPMTKEFSMFEAFDKHTRQLGYVPLASEKTVFDLSMSLAGSVDMLYIRKSDIDSKPIRVWMVDWKRSKEIKTQGFRDERGYPPFNGLQNCNLQHYTGQLNLYKFLLEKNHGFIIERMTLVILHPNQPEYLAIDVADIQETLKAGLRIKFPELDF